MPGLVDMIRKYERERRFWRGVEVGSRDECWPWHGGDSSVDGADRRAYRMARGPLPPGARLTHLCGSRACVNPDHMEIVRPA